MCRDYTSPSENARRRVKGGAYPTAGILAPVLRGSVAVDILRGLMIDRVVFLSIDLVSVGIIWVEEEKVCTICMYTSRCPGRIGVAVCRQVRVGNLTEGGAPVVGFCS